jgi:Inorganic pyrophosphatase/exopolyphosphatase
MAIIVCGHKNPDCDSITAAIAVADLLSKRGMEAIPCRSGPRHPGRRLRAEQVRPGRSRH